MSEKEKRPDKFSSKTSILSFFPPCGNSPSKRFQETTLKVKNQNNNNKNLKRKSKDKTIFTSPGKKSQIVPSEPIIISSDDSGAEENFVNAKSKKRKKSVDSVTKRKSRHIASKSCGESSATGIPDNYKKILDIKPQICEEKVENDDAMCNNGLCERAIDNEKSGNISDAIIQTSTKFATKKILAKDEPESQSQSSSKRSNSKSTNFVTKSEPDSEPAEYAPMGTNVPKNQDSEENKNNPIPCTNSAAKNEAYFESADDVPRDNNVPINEQNSNMEQQSSDENKEEKIAYYLLNFRQILDTVLGNDDDRALFEGTDDMMWIEKFNKLPPAAQKLYVRLYHRKMAWLRSEQVNYPGIAKNIHLVLKKLSHEGFLLSFDQDNTNSLVLNDILKLLPAPSLKELAKSYRITINGRQKTQIIGDLHDLCKKQRSVIGGFFLKKSQKTDKQKSGLEQNVMKRACRALGPCYRVAPYPRTVFNRVLLVFDVTRGIDDESECSLTGSQNVMGQGRHLQLSAILMAGMGKVSYPACKVDRPTPIFGRRADLLHYETAFQFQTDVLACVEAGQWQEGAALCDSANSVRLDIESNDKESFEHSKNMPEFLRCFTSQWTYTRLRSLEVEILQRLKNYKKAVDILQELLDQRTYCSSRRGHWWERLALNVDQHLKDPVRSLDVIYESLQDPDVRVGHKLALAQRVSKILASKSVKKLPELSSTYKSKLEPIIERLKIEEAPVVEISGRLLPGEVQTGKSRFVTTEFDDSDPTSKSTLLCSVEDLALSHYKGVGYDHGIHGEGGTFSTLFCLFLWDLIFMPGIPDVFRTSYQTHPLDYHTDGFYLRRRGKIEKRLKLIENLKEEDFLPTVEEDDKNERSSAIDILTVTWDMEYGKTCAGMNWERFSSLEGAKGFVQCIGGKILSGIFRRLAKDLRHTRSGLPDLVVWNPVDHIYKMVEVKGPGDRLSTNQKLWIDELMRLGANIEVCKVIAIGGKQLSRT